MQDKDESIENNTEKKDKVFFHDKKKKVVLISALLILIVVGVAVSFLIASILNKSDKSTETNEGAQISNDISGAWELIVNPELSASIDEAADNENAYYVFEAPDKYGRGSYYTCYQGGVEHFKYELLIEDSVEKINLGTENMEYEITGSKSNGDAELKIIFPAYTDESTGVSYEAQEYIFRQAENPDYENQSYEEFEINSALVGEKWTSNERTLAYYYYAIPYVETVEFTDRGVMIIHYESEELGLDRYMYYAYTINENKLTFSLVTDKDTKYTVSYSFDDMSNLKFSDDKTSSSIFADAFFGDFTFYTSENLPEPTEASYDELYYSE